VTLGQTLLPVHRVQVLVIITMGRAAEGWCFVFTSGSITGASSVAGGINGTSTTDLSPFGATPGGPGTLVQNTTPADIPLGISGAGCIPTPSVVKTTSTPSVMQTPTGTSGTYTMVVSVPAGQGTRLGSQFPITYLLGLLMLRPLR